MMNRTCNEKTECRIKMDLRNGRFAAEMCLACLALVLMLFDAASEHAFKAELLVPVLLGFALTIKFDRLGSLRQNESRLTT